MKTNFKTVAALMMLAAVAGCSNEPGAINSDDPVPMQVRTSVTKAPISAIPDTESIGLFVTTGTLGGNYAGNAAYANVKSTVSAGSWTNDPKVYLTSADATVYAYYPYAASVDGTAVAVDANQTDYLYATGASKVNNTNPTVTLVMQHALSMIQFKISKENYESDGNLTKIVIANGAGKTVLASKGTLNISNGTITPTPGENEPVTLTKSLTIPDAVPADPQTDLDMLVLPVSATAALGDVIITFTIDGKDYDYKVSAATAWVKGTKNVYTMVLKGTEMTGTVSVGPWTDGTTGGGDLQ